MQRRVVQSVARRKPYGAFTGGACSPRSCTRVPEASSCSCRQQEAEVPPGLRVQGGPSPPPRQAACKPGYAFPDGSSETLLVCEDRVWRDRNQPAGSPIPNCQGEAQPWPYFPAVCQPECRNGGLCIRPGYCHCRPEFQGDRCQVERGSPCLASPPAPANARVFCSGSER